MRDSNIESFQKAAAAFGLYTGKIDGLTGPKTRAALKSLRDLSKKHGLPVSTSSSPTSIDANNIFKLSAEGILRGVSNADISYDNESDKYIRSSQRAYYDFQRGIDKNDKDVWVEYAKDTSDTGSGIGDVLSSVSTFLNRPWFSDKTKETSNGRRGDGLLDAFAQTEIHVKDGTDDITARLYGAGAGVPYVYIGTGKNARKVNTNLYSLGDDARFKDRTDFMNYLSKLPVHQQQAEIKKERERQYQQFGIEDDMLLNKKMGAVNGLFDRVPYSYDSEGIKATFGKGSQKGKSTLDLGENQLHATVAISANGNKKYSGRVASQDGNFDTTIEAISGNPFMTGNLGISSMRAATSSYAAGFPLVSNLRKELEIVEGKPDGNKVDATPYYSITDPKRGNTAMKARMAENIDHIIRKIGVANYKKLMEKLKSSNPDLDSDNTVSLHKYSKDSTQGILEQLGWSQLIPMYRSEMIKQSNGIGSSDDISIGFTGFMAGLGDWLSSNLNKKQVGITSPHITRYSELVEDYLNNAFDENGKPVQKFKYADYGYDGDTGDNDSFDGGKYTVTVKRDANGNIVPVRAEDNWNIDLNGVTDFNTNKQKGIQLIRRFE